MTLVADTELSDDQSRLIAARVREELARRRISRQRLADEARISISTLEKALAGRRPFTLATLIRLEEALGVPLRASEPGRSQAPESLGAYSRAAVAWIEGAYLTLRPSFESPNAIYAYSTEIAWEAAASCLMFRESARQDQAFSQSGQVSLPNQSGHIYLATNDRGQFRLITLGRPTIAGEMYGLMSTLQSGEGGRLLPVAVPVVFVPIRDEREVCFGLISPGEAAFESYRNRLERVLRESFARLISP